MPNFMKGLFHGATKKAVNIQRACYTMSMTDGLDAEIQFYGEIVRTKPIDWWTGEPEPGDFITLDEFLEDLKSIAAAKTLLMRIDSIGGNSEVSIVIHNRLRELPAKKTARIDGVAMSGGTHIACAADNIQVNPASQFMIHKCWTYFWGAYNADELRAEADQLDPTDKSQLAIYKVRTGKPDDEILSMMSKTTTMVGQEIIDAGFADEMLDAATDKPEIAASADGRSLYVNGRALRMAPFMKLPEGIKVVDPAQAADTNTKQPAQTGGPEGGNTMANTLEELKKENPALASQLLAEAQAAASAELESSGKSALEEERKRIKEIDEVSALYSEEMVQEAKYGENPCTAQELTYRAAKEMAKQGKKFLDGIESDTQASGTQKVSALPGTDDGNINTADATPEQLMSSARSEVQALFGKKKEG